jgi:hypothetical protein
MFAKKMMMINFLCLPLCLPFNFKSENQPSPHNSITAAVITSEIVRDVECRADISRQQTEKILLFYCFSRSLYRIQQYTNRKKEKRAQNSGAWAGGRGCGLLKLFLTVLTVNPTVPPHPTVFRLLVE